MAVPTYDSSGDGDVTNDGQNQYLYDGDGRVCAIKNMIGKMVQYLYDAEGTRVAKGTITSWSCNTASNGFQLTTSYILTPGNQQLTELTWSGSTAQWAHTNVWGAGAGGPVIRSGVSISRIESCARVAWSSRIAGISF